MRPLSDSETPRLQDIIRELEELHAGMLRLVDENLSAIEAIHPDNRTSARNLLHYLALRQHDLRELQERLAALGLSSLGRTEAHVLSAVTTLLDVLAKLSGAGRSSPRAGVQGCGRQEGRRLLEENTDLLLGPAPDHRDVRIMVTAPSEAATDNAVVLDLLAGGMNCMRINCAHDDQDAWAGMIRNLRQASEKTGKRCKIEMDLAGPKLRTGPIEPGPAVVRSRPRRDAYGRVTRPARIWLGSADHQEPPPAAADVSLPVPEMWLSTLGEGDVIRFVDARGSRRSITVRQAIGKGYWAESTRTAYFTPGLELVVVGGPQSRTVRRARVGPIAPKLQTLELKRGDRLILTRSLEPGQPARPGQHGEVVGPARIGVTLPEFFDCVQPGEPVWLDDGTFGCVVSAVEPAQVIVEIMQAPVEGGKLGAGKGINVPETNLPVAPLTEDDLKALESVVKQADIVAYSFVRTEEDVHCLQARLAEVGAQDLGIVLKIETRQAFDNLPRLLLAAMRSRSVGVMIARGDLAVECGYERLAEVQEEILWVSEAAHIPVIWATQVLESLAKTGRPSRSEITDAAMGVRAECVMLNKGPYVIEAVKTLDNILRRMQEHQDKKSSMLRQLRLATGFIEAHGGGMGGQASDATVVRRAAATLSCHPSA